MAMEDILKALVDSRQPGSSGQSGADAMTNLVGSLLGGSGSGGGSSQTGLGDVMNILEGVMNQGGQGTGTSDPIMMMLQPFVNQLATKMKVSPEIATVVISFVVHQLLAHHPTSGRDSNSFNLDDMLQQMSSGNVDTSLLRSSGMISELSKKTGLDDATTEQSLQLAFKLVGKTITNLENKSNTSAKPSSLGAKGKAMGSSTKSGAGAKKGKK